MLNAPSWADALHAAKTPTAQAEIHLQRAQQRQSKKLISEDIQTALDLIHPTEAYSLQLALQWYSLPYSQAGLHQLAFKLLQALQTE